MAVTTTYGECFNPTEAGSRDDGQQTITTSAFWMIPGECESGCGCAINTVNVTDFIMHKHVTIGYKNISNVIHYVSDVIIPFDVNSTQIEAPTAYLNPPFNTFYSIDVKNGGGLVRIAISDDTGGHVGS
eukprot:391709_1